MCKMRETEPRKDPPTHSQASDQVEHFRRGEDRRESSPGSTPPEKFWVFLFRFGFSSSGPSPGETNIRCTSQPCRPHSILPSGPRGGQWPQDPS